MKPQLNHVAICVTNSATLIRFYQELLGVTVTDCGSSSSSRLPITLMSSNPAQHHQFVLVHGRAKDAPSTVNQLSFKIANIAGLREVATKAVARGLKVRQTSYGTAWSAYFRYPEGNQTEVCMDTPWHVAQPHGDQLDPSLSDEEIHAQTEKIVHADPMFMIREAREAELARMLGQR